MSPERVDITRLIGFLEEKPEPSTSQGAKTACTHPPEKITFYQGNIYIDPVTKDMMQIGGVWVCECGESWDHDPAEDASEE